MVEMHKELARALSEREKLALKRMVPLFATSSSHEEFNAGMRNFLSRPENSQLFSENEISKLSEWYGLMSNLLKNRDVRINSAHITNVERAGTVCRTMLLLIWNYKCASFSNPEAEIEPEQIGLDENPELALRLRYRS